MIQPIFHSCDSPTIQKMCGLLGDRIDRVSNCDKSLLLWSYANSHVANACSLMNESVACLASAELPEPKWTIFSNGLTEDMAKKPSLSIHLIHALFATYD